MKTPRTSGSSQVKFLLSTQIQNSRTSGYFHPSRKQCIFQSNDKLFIGKGGPSLIHHSGSFSCLSHHSLLGKTRLEIAIIFDRMFNFQDPSLEKSLFFE